MATASPIPLYRSPDDLRERLLEMRDDLVDRMVRRGTPEPAHLPMLGGIEATLRVLDGEEIAARPEPVPRGSAMAAANPDGLNSRYRAHTPRYGSTRCWRCGSAGRFWMRSAW
jgi:hypothetical protein